MQEQRNHPPSNRRHLNSSQIRRNNVQSAANLLPRDHQDVAQGNDREVPEQNPDRQIQVQSRSYVYSVNAQRFFKSILNVALSCVVYTGLVLLFIMVMVIDKIDLSATFSAKVEARWEIPLIILSMISVTLALLTLVNTKSLSAIQVFTTVDIAVYLTLAAILYGMEINYQWILAVVCGSVGLVLSVIFLKDKCDAIIYLLLLCQMTFVGLKADGKVNEIEWKYIFILPLICIAGGVLISLFFFIMAIRLRQDYLLNQFIIAYLYKGIQSLGFSLTLGLLTLRALTTLNPFGLALTCALYFFIVVGLYLYFFKVDIALYGAQAEPVDFLGFLLDISYQKIERESALYRLSDNWLTFDRDKVGKHVQQKEDCKEEQLKKCQLGSGNECTVCLTDRLAFVWMPCGHLTVCQGCGQYLRNNKKIECIICKTNCDEIYHISQLGPVGRQSQSDYLFKVERVE